MKVWQNEDKSIKLINGDCLDVMDKMIEKNIKVDLTITSPPYDNLRNYKGTLEWNENIWKSIIDKLYQITVDGGVVVWVVGDATIKGSETGTSFKQALYFKEVGFNLHDTMIWYKPNAMPQIDKSRFTQSFEYMFIFSKGKPKTTNPKMVKTKLYGKVYNRGDYNKESIITAKNNKVKKYRISFNVYELCVGGKSHGHPAVFPEKLAEDHILSWSNEGDIVFDPMMGSNTVGKMAKLNNRKFIGIEKVEEYFDISIERIKSL